ncbi:uroporphyrinogen-III C-methyltransferase [Novilysobacter erysipheiresistens]|uniref:Uroporphyrinogen-III C-methyltransferase n=1 Tax=Novilysobacter erysipheiresistens TaxID=1749332 RepID=A0ABU7YXX0_9GAMM
MSATPDPSPRRRSRLSAWLLSLLVVLLLVAAAGWYGWQWWQARQAASDADATMQLDALSERVAALRRDQRAQAQRLQQADATNRVLRDELLGLGERSAIIEDSFARFADPDRHGAQALRLDETELLLSLGQQRLLVAGDLDGARRAYALAAGVLAGVDDPTYLSLRQSLGQERAALEAIEVEPRAQALARLATFAATVASAAPVPRHDAAQSNGQPWWRRAFAAIVEVQPTDRAVAVQPADIAAARAGLQLEISLARAAAERRDVDGYRAALARADAWLTRLLPPSDERERQRRQLREIASLPLSLSLPPLGTTLRQLRESRATRRES